MMDGIYVGSEKNMGQQCQLSVSAVKVERVS